MFHFGSGLYFAKNRCESRPVSESAEKLFREALVLSPNERIGLVEELLNSLDKPDPEIDVLWAKEAEDRLRAYRSGEVQAYSAEEVFSELSRF